ncbi:MAG: transcription-repair coupling factor [Oscillospiraceae bacterium]|jgi:transcription-repair coupling factor (superfamily II helicase)|nr:transcription-repair coupling factor [Oscillospiraceae bacterium]
MYFLTATLQRLPEFAKLCSHAKGRTVTAATGLTHLNKAITIFSLCRLKNVRAFCIASDEAEAQTLCNDLCSMGLAAVFYPGRDFVFKEVTGKSHEFEHQRLDVLQKILQKQADVVVACIDAALQYTIPPEVLQKATLKLKPGQIISPEKCAESLLLLGYQRFAQIEGFGQFALRGGILDFFVPGDKNPIRIEFFGNEIDSLNYFDIETQRRTEKVDEITLSPSAEVIIGDFDALSQKITRAANALQGKAAAKAKEILHDEAEQIKNGIKPSNIDKFIAQVYDKPACLTDYFTGGDICFVLEHMKVKERVKSANFEYEHNLLDYFNEGTLCRGFDEFSRQYSDFLDFTTNRPTIFLDNFAAGGYDLPMQDLFSFSAKQTSPWNGSTQILAEDLDAVFHPKATVTVLCGTEKSAKNVAESLCERGLPAIFCKSADKLSHGKIYCLPGALSAGIEYPQIDFYLISHGLASYAPIKKKRQAKKQGQEIYSLSELAYGDYVVHSTHGIGVFQGVSKLTTGGITKDYIKIKYQGADTLYVPVTQLDLVAKYIGPKENTSVKLSRLGGGEWTKAKARVRSSVKDMAKELIALYSARMKAPGFAFAPDSEWQHDFERGFEFDETPDQMQAAEEIKSDMEKSSPMDRLLCGDVGFGKTEVALRAAFKCVTDGKQCVLLCPTTILAWQHYQTVLRRFERFPVRVELLSRFRTKKQQEEIIKKLRRGEIDMIIGTHRLVQKDVIFRDLGLCIIDEEQRFGVAQKERFKELCKNVDVLTLSATPIPRTLNMSLSGVRDMSVLEEAPQNRHPVQTYVLEYDSGIINEAIRRELRRGGQVFYLHNRTESIAGKAAKIQAEIPEARVGIGHGRMNEGELSKVWAQMLEQEINVLVCTTIVETGVDLPNANTFIIENADCMGLSQLHQLRGRVGRSARRAYAYFTYPPQKVLSDISQKRLTAIREYTEFGSGFKIAMRDLELRGAGNILGGQQHGHMEDVGYDMYLKLLAQAVAEEKGEAPAPTDDKDCLIDIAVQAHIPDYYIENTSQRLDIYKLIADIKTNADADDVLDELNDRFGAVPKVVKGLVDIALIRNIASLRGIYEIKQNNEALLLFVRDIKAPQTGEILKAMGRKAVLSAGAKPYISVKVPTGTSTLERLKLILGV